jgi:hypothetical protein
MHEGPVPFQLFENDIAVHLLRLVLSGLTHVKASHVREYRSGVRRHIRDNYEVPWLLRR